MALRADTAPDELDRFRIALETELERKSLRAVARTLQMSPSGLQKFLNGSRPYGETLGRLRGWYYGKAGVRHTPPPLIAAELRRYVITAHAPDVGVAKLLEAVASTYQESGMLVPEWVDAVRALIT